MSTDDSTVDAGGSNVTWRLFSLSPLSRSVLKPPPPMGFNAALLFQDNDGDLNENDDEVDHDDDEDEDDELPDDSSLPETNRIRSKDREIKPRAVSHTTRMAIFILRPTLTISSKKSGLPTSAYTIVAMRPFDVFGTM